MLFALCAVPALAAPFDPQAATEAYLKSVSAADKLKSDAYFEGGYWLILWNALWNLGIAAILLVGGLSARMRDVAFRIGRKRWIAVGIYGALFVVISTVLSFPLDVYQGFFREHAYGLSNQGFGGWAGDQAINLAVGAVSFAILLPVIYVVIRATPRFWWAWGTGVVMGFLVIGVVLGPVFLEPLLNHFQPLPDGPLRSQIVAMARADGIPTTNVVEYDSSRQTSRISAHVSGLFGTTRISMTDNLIRQCTPDQVLAVLGHEMGHYVMGHVFNFVLWLSAIVAVGFAFGRWCYGSLLPRFGARWRVENVADPAGFPVLFGAFTLYIFLLTPLLNTLTRTQEMQADLFGLNLVRRPDAFAQVALKLSTYRKLDPSPLEEFVFYDHPSGHTRIYTAMRWKAELGQ